MSTPSQPEKQSKREVASEDISTWLSGPGALFVGGLVIVLAVTIWNGSRWSRRVRWTT